MEPHVRRPFLPALLLLLFAPCGAAFAAIRLPLVISDHAVLQRDRPLHLWGWATPGAELQLRLHGQTAEAKADELGEWSVWLKPEPAGGPYTLTVDGDGHREVTDLLLGDVWIASGQSNMEMPLRGFGPETQVKNSAEEIRSALQPRIRLLNMRKRGSTFPVDDIQDTWTACTPETAKEFSAVGYLFAREISQRENVAIGVIDSTWGGTPADSWVSLDTLGADPGLVPAFAARARFAQHYARRDAEMKLQQKEEAEAKLAGKKAPVQPWHPAEESWLPGGLFNGMIAPLTPLSIRGFLWYQGETNSSPGRAPFYAQLFPALIRDWRMHFAQGDLPFLFVQISSFHSPLEDWGTIRDAQRRTLSVANTAMAVTLDVGLEKNVHPPDKQAVAARLVLAARAVAYGEQLRYASPLFRQATVEGSAMRVWFDNAQGLTAKPGRLGDFEVAGDDHHFITGKARLEGDTVVVSAVSVPQPKYVRYGWQGVVNSYLYNGDGLPLGTFTSEPMPGQLSWHEP